MFILQSAFTPIHPQTLITDGRVQRVSKLSLLGELYLTSALVLNLLVQSALLSGALRIRVLLSGLLPAPPPQTLPSSYNQLLPVLLDFLGLPPSCVLSFKPSYLTPTHPFAFSLSSRKYGQPPQ